MAQWTILRKGTFTGVGNRTVEVDDSVLNRIVEYAQSNEGAREIPIVKGHPKMDDPKWGGVALSSIQRVGDTIVAEPAWLDETVKSDISSKRFDACSLKFNPSTGKIFHLGILGAHAPAVDGLPAISLADVEEDADAISVVEFADGRMPQVGALLRRMRDMMIEDKGLEYADKIFPADELSGLDTYLPEVPEWLSSQIDALYSKLWKIESRVDSLPIANEPAQFAADVKTITDTRMSAEEELQAERAKSAELEQQLTEMRNQQQAAELAAFVDSSELRCRIMPADRNEVLAVLGACSAAAETVEFAAGEEQVETTLLDSVKKLLRKLPVVVELGGAVEGEAIARTDSDDDVEKMVRHANRHNQR